MFCHGELAAAQARAALPDALLPDGLARRRARRRRWSGIVAPLVLPAYFELAFGLVVVRAAAAVAGAARRPPVFGVLAVVGAGRDARLRRLERSASSTTTRSSRRATSTACCACRKAATTRRAATARSSTARSCTATQYLAPDFARRPTTYYTQTSGIGRAARVAASAPGAAQGRHDRPRRRARSPPTARKGDVYRFYDINPGGDRASRSSDFTYLSDSDATIEMRARRRAADARARAAAAASTCSRSTPSRATRSPSTSSRRKRSTIYRRHMKPGGVIAFHVTNRYPRPRSRSSKALADAHGLHARAGSPTTATTRLRSRSDWVLVSRQRRIARPIRRSPTPRRRSSARRDWRAVDRRLQQPRAGAEVSRVGDRLPARCRDHARSRLRRPIARCAARRAERALHRGHRPARAAARAASTRQHRRRAMRPRSRSARCGCAARR